MKTAKQNKTRKTAKAPTNFNKGQKVQIRNRHFGCAGSTGRVKSAPERLQGHWYWDVKLTGGKGAGLSIRFLAAEMATA